MPTVSNRQALPDDPGPCACVLAGYCDRYKREMTARPHAICRGENISPEKAATYRRNWLASAITAAARPALPPLTTQIANLAKAIKTWALHGFPVRTDEQVNEVLAICAGCAHFTEGKCAACGCDLVRKAKLATESCPAGKWSAIA